MTMNGPRLVTVGLPQSFRQQVARALAVETEEVDWVPSATAAEVVVGNSREVDVLALSPGMKEADAMGLAGYVRRHAPFTSVVLVRDRAGDGLLTAAMRAGVRDVVDLSRGGEDLREALQGALEWTTSLRFQNTHADHAPSRNGRIVSVFSSKGGTGKTFLATNVAAAIALMTPDRDTALVDLDLDLGDVFAYFGREPTFSLRDLATLDEGDRDAILAHGDKLGEGLWGFASPSDPAAESITGEAMGRILREIRSAFDFVVVDATSEYSDCILSAIDLSDEILLVAALDVVSVRHLSMALQTLGTLGVPRDRCRVVLNRADSKVDLKPSEVEEVLKVRVDATVPSSRMVPLSLNRGRPVLLAEPRSEVAKSVRRIATSIVARAAEAPSATDPPGVARADVIHGSKRGIFSRR